MNTLNELCNNHVKFTISQYLHAQITDKYVVTLKEDIQLLLGLVKRTNKTHALEI